MHQLTKKPRSKSLKMKKYAIKVHNKTYHIHYCNLHSIDDKMFRIVLSKWLLKVSTAVAVGLNRHYFY